MHGAKNFPVRKAASDLDVGLPDGCTDTPYLHALDEALGEAWSRHGDRPPRLAFYLAGADPHEADRLGRLALTRRAWPSGIGVCSRRAGRAALPWRW